MKNLPWSDSENDIIVADYFAMLEKELSFRKFSKSEHRRALLGKLDNRSEGSIEFKHQNISAVLKGLGETWIVGYRPAFNFQMALVEAVSRHLSSRLGKENPSSLARKSSFAEDGALYIGPPPTLSNQLPPDELEQMQLIASKFDVAKRDEQNRNLGLAGEELIFQHERSNLLAQGQAELASKVQWTSQDVGDGMGYDIESYEPIAKCVLYAPEIAPRLGIFRYVFDSDKTHFALMGRNG